jgi:hypothetical protein
MFIKVEKILYTIAFLSLLMAALIAAEKYSSIIGRKAYEETIRTYKTAPISVPRTEKE